MPRGSSKFAKTPEAIKTQLKPGHEPKIVDAGGQEIKQGEYLERKKNELSITGSANTKKEAEKVLRATKTYRQRLIDDYLDKINDMKDLSEGYKSDGKRASSQQQQEAFYKYNYFLLSYDAGDPLELAEKMADGFLFEKSRTQALQDISGLTTKLALPGVEGVKKDGTRINMFAVEEEA